MVGFKRNIPKDEGGLHGQQFNNTLLRFSLSVAHGIINRFRESLGFSRRGTVWVIVSAQPVTIIDVCVKAA